MGCEIEGPDLSKHIAKSKQIDAVLERCWDLEQAVSVAGLMALFELPPDR